MAQDDVRPMHPQRPLSHRTHRRALMAGCVSAGVARVVGLAEVTATGSPATGFRTAHAITRMSGLELRPDEELLALWQRAGVIYDFAPINGIYRPAPAVDPVLLESDLDLY